MLPPGARHWQLIYPYLGWEGEACSCLPFGKKSTASILLPGGRWGPGCVFHYYSFKNYKNERNSATAKGRGKMRNIFEIFGSFENIYKTSA
jgi:hypothetical protein